MQDTYRHKGMRRALVRTLQTKGITNERVLAAMDIVPRHFFLDTAFADHAYEDKAFPIGNKQTISQPYTVAFQTQLLEVKKREKVLEIGTGSGYQAAILGALGARVYTVERQEALFIKTKKLLRTLNIGNIRCFFRDGSMGLPEFASFDKIIATAGATEVPEALRMQLKIGGILVIPIGEKDQVMYRIRRTAENEWLEEETGDFRFVPFLSGLNKKNT